MNRIVIADDSSTARMFIQRCLEISGCRDAEFIEAANGREAIEHLRASPTDLLISDLHMPEMDGLALLKFVKSSPRLHDIPVIIISSAANPKKIKELSEAKAFKILKKPISPAVLTTVIEPLLKNQEVGQ